MRISTLYSISMKKNTHPKFYPKAKITCVCGANFEIGSTLEKIDIELCSKCHPFYTGKQKIVDTARRVEKFAERASKKVSLATQGGRKAKRVKRTTQKETKKPKFEKDEE